MKRGRGWGVAAACGLLVLGGVRAEVVVCEQQPLALTTALSYELPAEIFTPAVCASGRVAFNLKVDNSELCGWTLFASEGIWLLDGEERLALLNPPAGGAPNFGRLLAGQVLRLEFGLPAGFDGSRPLKLHIRAGVYSWEAPKGEFRISIWHGVRLFLSSYVDRVNRVCRLKAELPPGVEVSEYRWQVAGGEPTVSSSGRHKLRMRNRKPFEVKLSATLADRSVVSATTQVVPHSEVVKPPLADGQVLVGLCFYVAKPDALKTEEDEKRVVVWQAPRLAEPYHSAEYVRMMQRDKLGNLAVFWPNVPDLTIEEECKLVRELADDGIYTMSIYQHRDRESVDKLREAARGSYFLNNNIGEYASYLYQSIDSAEACKIPQEGNLKECRDYFTDRYVGEGVLSIQRSYPYIFSTSGAVLANYELEGGIEFISGELYAIGAQNLAYSTSEMRGAARKWQPEFWAGWLAQEWQSVQVPYQSEQKFHLLKAGLYQQYMMGTSIIVLESGSQTTQAGYYTKDSGQVNFPYEHEVPSRYRQTMKEFYEFVQKEGKRAAGTPETRIALAQGNCDCYLGLYIDWFVPWAQYKSAERDANWKYGDPERSSLAAQQLFFPMPADALKPYGNAWLAGTPYGQTDVVGVDELSCLEDLVRYELLVYSGWNTMTPAIMRLLAGYVEQGGTLLLAVPHLSTRLDREYYNYQVSDLVGGGNLAPLMDLKVSGFETVQGVDGEQSWLAGGEVAKVEAGKGVEVVERAGGLPLLVRQKRGKGSVSLLLTRGYPGRAGGEGYYKRVVGALAERFRGKVFVAGDYETRSYINYAVYGDRVYLLNIDGQGSRKFSLVVDGKAEEVELGAGEFRSVLRGKVAQRGCATVSGE